MNEPLLILLPVEPIITGIAIISNPFGFSILADSLKKYCSGLKCCADSKATILSTHSSAKGNVVAVAFTNERMSPHITGVVVVVVIGCLTFTSAVLITLLSISV